MLTPLFEQNKYEEWQTIADGILIRKNGNGDVEINLNFVDSLIAMTWKTIATLPAAYRTSMNTFFTCILDGVSITHGEVNIDNEGRIQVKSATTQTNVNVRLFAKYNAN